MRIFLLAGLALLPGLGLAWYFYGRDRHQPEPRRLVWGTFFLGAFYVVPAGLLEVGLSALTGWGEDSGALGKTALYSFLCVGLVEEFFKLLALRPLYSRPEFDETIDGLVYGAAAGAGFACMENLFYVLDQGFGVGVVRALLSVPVHVFMAMLLGYGLAKRKLAGTLWAVPAAWALAAACHGLFDLVLLRQAPDRPGASALISVVVVLILAVWVGRAVDQTSEESRLAAGGYSGGEPAAGASFGSLPRLLFLFFGAGALLWTAFLTLGYVLLCLEGTFFDGWIYFVTAVTPAFAGAAALHKAAKS